RTEEENPRVTQDDVQTDTHHHEGGDEFVLAEPRGVGAGRKGKQHTDGDPDEDDPGSVRVMRVRLPNNRGSAEAGHTVLATLDLNMPSGRTPRTTRTSASPT